MCKLSAGFCSLQYWHCHLALLKFGLKSREKTYLTKFLPSAHCTFSHFILPATLFYDATGKFRNIEWVLLSGHRWWVSISRFKLQFADNKFMLSPYTVTFLRIRGRCWLVYIEKKGLESNCLSAEWHPITFDRWGSIPITDILEWGQPFIPQNVTEQPLHCWHHLRQINYPQNQLLRNCSEKLPDLSLKEIIKNKSV